MIILICGLPGSGKTTLAKSLIPKLGNNVNWLNADIIRATNNDWDFTKQGRIRQANRIKNISNKYNNYKYTIIDMICPTKELRNIINPDITIWMDTIKEGRYEDTNKLFEPLEKNEYSFKILNFNADYWSSVIAFKIVNSK